MNILIPANTHLLDAPDPIHRYQPSRHGTLCREQGLMTEDERLVTCDVCWKLSDRRVQGRIIGAGRCAND